MCLFIKKQTHGLKKVKDWTDTVAPVAFTRSTSWPLIGLIHGRLDILSQNMKMWVSAVKSVSKLNGRRRTTFFSPFWKYCFKSESSFLLCYLLSWFIFNSRRQRGTFHRINPLMIHLQLAYRSRRDAVFSLRAVSKKQQGNLAEKRLRPAHDGQKRKHPELCCFADDASQVRWILINTKWWTCSSRCLASTEPSGGSSTSLRCLSVLRLLLHLSHTRCCLLSIDQWQTNDGKRARECRIKRNARKEKAPIMS